MAAKKEIFCFFIGHHRSGHSIIGALLDAHPDIVIPHEYHALAYVQHGCTRRELFMNLAALSFRQAHEGRHEGKYSYVVPGWWQGRFRTLQVVGDKKGSGSTDLLMESPCLLETLKNCVQRELRIIYVTRNPFDNITSQLRYTPHPLSEEQIRFAVEHYFKQVETNAGILCDYAKQALCFRHEDFVENPTTLLRQLCTFLGVEILEDYLRDCAAIVYRSPNKSRHEMKWAPNLVEEITKRIHKYPFFASYTFEN